MAKRQVVLVHTQNQWISDMIEELSPYDILVRCVSEPSELKKIIKQCDFLLISEQEFQSMDAWMGAEDFDKDQGEQSINATKNKADDHCQATSATTLANILQASKVKWGVVVSEALPNRNETILSYFSLGATDCYLESDSVAVMGYRIRKVLSIEDGPSKLFYQDYYLDSGLCSILDHKGTRVRLTRQEFLLMTVFFEQPGEIVRSSVMYERLWGEQEENVSERFRTLIKELRRKVAPLSLEILSQYGIGYYLK